LSIKVHLAVGAHGLSVSVVLTCEQSHDLTMLQDRDQTS
jgi:hypothetical protein